MILPDLGATKGMTELGVCMSNFDHEIEDGLDKKLRDGNVWAGYTGWNFFGRVWHDGEKFRCEVWQYRSIMETMDAASLKGVMATVCEKYGVG